MVAAIEQGFPQREIAESSYQFQQAIERGEKTIVGVNDFVEDDAAPIETLVVDDRAAALQIERLADLKRSRDPRAVATALADLRAKAATDANLMPALLTAVRAYATLGEMCDALREAWGEYEEVPII
jgi:methylmalonyl-CoA mutase N-terminal domain/subunit